MSRNIRHMRNTIVLFIAAGLLAGVAAAAVPVAAAAVPVAAAAAPDDAAARRKRETELIRMLKGPASVAEKDKACRELQVIGTPACVSALAALLTEDELSHMARYALEPMPYPQAGKALRDALGKTRGAVKVGVIGSLGFREDKQAIGDLIPLLGDRDPAVAGAAAAALGRIGTPEAAKALAAFRAKAGTTLRGVAAEASLTAAQRLVAQGEGGAAAAICEALQSPQWPAHVRLGAFVTLLSTGGEAAVAQSLAAIAGDDAAIRAVAIANLAALKGSTVDKRLAAELPKLPPGAQVLLIGALTARGNPAVRPAIVAAAGSDDAGVRIAAYKALGAVGDAGCAALLCKAVAKGASDAETQAAVSSLQVLPGETVNATILSHMKAAAPGPRAKLIYTLAVRKAGGVVGELLTQARGDDARVRTAALKGLGWLGEPSDLPALVALLVASTGDSAAASGAAQAVVLVSRKVPDEAARADAVLAALKRTGATPAKCSLLGVLSDIGNAKAFQAVRGALAEKDAEVRDAAVRALADWPDGRALPALLGVCTRTENPTHRVLALRGGVRLLGLGDTPAAERLAAYRELMAVAKRREDRQLVLAGLGRVADPAAVAMVEPLLGDPSVGAEAELAMLTLARGIAGIAPDRAKAAARSLRAKSKNKTIRRQAGEIIDQIDKFADYIMAWHISGPYSKGNLAASALFDVPFAPEGVDPAARWRPLLVGRASKLPMLDLTGFLGGDQRVAYARTYIHSERTRPARLEMGVDDGVKAWVNGKVVHTNNSAGAAVPGEEKVKVSLKAGWNVLMLKIVQHTGPWEFCARLRAADGGSIDGLRIDPTRGGTTAPSPPVPPAGAVTAGPWRPLFNGKDLTGWKKTGTAIFTVEDGSLVGTQTDGRGGDLWTVAEFDDFELQITYRVVWPANSGFWFRHDGRRGYQYDVLKYKRPVAFSGTLYCPGKMFLTKNLNEALENRDGWNEARVRAVGDELTLWLNGTQTGAARDKTLAKGRIGIQIHPGNGFKGMKMIIKKMEIRSMKRKGG